MRVGINGIGIGGPTLAYWLREYGHEPVLFERADRLRTEGYLVDFWGLGFQVAERMGIIEKIRDQAYAMERLSFVDDGGREQVGLDLGAVRRKWSGRFFTVARGDICQAIFSACDGIPSHFGVHIVGVEEDGTGVTAALSDGTTERFDAVIGADGLHSAIREQAFGEEAHFEKFLGCWVAAFRARDYPHRNPLEYVAHTEPGRWAARISRNDGDSMILLIFRDELLERRPARGEEQSVLRRVYGDMGWEAQEILDHMQNSPGGIYFDRVSQIHMNTWSKGRVGLVGDAAACASLLAGEGTGLAMTEAYVMAGELHRAKGDVEQAFTRYYTRLSAFVAKEQKGAEKFRFFFVPSSRAQLWLRNQLIRVASLPGLIGIVAGGAAPPFDFEDYRASA
jgi:2-polyprenyl-6-methoxyphenol hydroxylase-like FAD-dependent oxidoreductase